MIRARDLDHATPQRPTPEDLAEFLALLNGEGER